MGATIALGASGTWKKHPGSAPVSDFATSLKSESCMIILEALAAAGDAGKRTVKATDLLPSLVFPLRTRMSAYNVDIQGLQGIIGYAGSAHRMALFPLNGWKLWHWTGPGFKALGFQA